MQVSLGRWEGFVDEAVSAGRYPSADAVIEAGLALLERQEAMHRELRAHIQAAIDEGGEVSDEELDRAIDERIEELRRSGIVD